MISDDTSANTLPGLPFELQISILSHIPPNQLFFLRCVSHGWNMMLSNPNVLDAINKTIPFLTSAPDLTSRMKRRMRMARGEPVWAKTFNEAFPWAAGYDNPKVLTHWKQFSEGWMVLLTGPLHIPAHTYAKEQPELMTANDAFKLIIGGLHVSGVAEVHVSDVLRQVRPELYEEWVENRFGPNRDAGRIDIESFHFHVEEGMVVVGLWVRKNGQLCDM